MFITPSFKKSLIVEQFQGNYLNTNWKIGVRKQGYVFILTDFKSLFTWREGAPTNQATRLEGLKHSLPASNKSDVSFLTSIIVSTVF